MESFKKKLYKYYIIPNFLIVFAVVIGFIQYQTYSARLDSILDSQIEVSKEIEFLSSATELVDFKESKRNSFYINNEADSWKQLLNSSIQKLEKTYSKSNDNNLLNLKEYNHAKKLLEDLQKNSEALIDLINKVGHQDWGIIGSLRTNVHIIETILSTKRKHDLIALNHLLEIRRNEKDFLLRGDKKYTDLLSKKVSLLLKLFQSYPEHVKPALVSNLQEYHTKFKTVAKLKEKIGYNAGEGLKEIGTDYIINLLVIQKNIIKKIQNQRDTKITIIKSIATLLALVGVILLLFYAIRTSTDLSRPVNLLRDSFEKLSAGKLKGDVIYDGRDEFKDVFNKFNKMTKELSEKSEEIIRERNTNVLILESLNVYICLHDLGGKILYTNKAFIDNLGVNFSTSSSMNKRLSSKLSLSKSELNKYETVVSDIDGNEIPVSISTRFIKREESKYLVVSIENQKDSVLLKKLKDTQEQLIQTAKLASLGELNSSLGHELNNPLQIISGMVEILLDEFQEIKEELILESLDQIQSSVARMRKIIDHLRSYSRKEGHEYHPFDLNKVFEDSLILCQNSLRNQNILTEIKLYQKPLFVKMKRTMIEQVFVNLINNAKDEILINGKNTKKPIITCHFTRVEENALFSIHNYGEEIPEKVKSKIFDPFFTTKKNGDGTGLGLSISHKIITEHHGNIWVESDKDGTTFFFKLPLDEENI